MNSYLDMINQPIARIGTILGVAGIILFYTQLQYFSKYLIILAFILIILAQILYHTKEISKSKKSNPAYFNNVIAGFVGGVAVAIIFSIEESWFKDNILFGLMITLMKIGIVLMIVIIGGRIVNPMRKK